MPQDLKPQQFEAFDYNLDFAGRSARGIHLSVKGSPGPARIGPYPIVEEAPPGWLTFYPHPFGLILCTDQPRLAFVGMRHDIWTCYDHIAIHPDDLPAVINLQRSHRKVDPSELPVEQVSVELIRVLARHAHQLRLIIAASEAYVRVPSSVQLRQDEWNILSRHIFTGKGFGPSDQTVPCSGLTYGLIGLPGTSLGEVANRWGIAEETPCAYEDKTLFFKSIHVVDAAKLGVLYPQAKPLAGRRLVVHSSELNRTEWTQEADDPGGAQQLQRFPLLQAHNAGVIPKTGDLVVDRCLEHILLPAGSFDPANLNCPLESVDSGYLLCPQLLINSHLLSCAKAARTYTLPKDLRKYRVCSFGTNKSGPTSLTGRYYLSLDLAGLPFRDMRRERRERKARHDRLLAQYGHELPVDYAKYTDQELEIHFRIKEAVARGELVSIINHPLLPEYEYDRERFLGWLSQNSSDFVVTCPVTEQHYLRAGVTVDDLAALPAIWTAVAQVVDEANWLRRLVLSPRFRAAAVADAI